MNESYGRLSGCDARLNQGTAVGAYAERVTDVQKSTAPRVQEAVLRAEATARELREAFIVLAQRLEAAGVLQAVPPSNAKDASGVPATGVGLADSVNTINTIMRQTGEILADVFKRLEI